MLVFTREANIRRVSNFISRSSSVLGVPDAIWNLVLPGRFLYRDPLRSTSGRRTQLVTVADICSATKAPISEGSGKTVTKASVRAIDQSMVTAQGKGK